MPDSPSAGQDATFAAHSPRLWALAYRMLGTRADSDDAVQDTWLRWHGADTPRIQNAEAWLVTVCTRICLDMLKATPRRKGEYIGPWVPEPLIVREGHADHPATPVSRAEHVSLALLHMLERLTPMERAAFVLRELFDHEYDAIAAVLDRSPESCRQLVSRARRRLGDETVRFPIDPTVHGTVLNRFAAAISSGDVTAVERFLTADATLWNDGGGKVTAARNVIFGANRVARFLLGVYRKAPPQGLALCMANGLPALLLLKDEGKRYGVLAIALSEGARIDTVYFVLNPDKLGLAAAAPLS